MLYLRPTKNVWNRRVSLCPAVSHDSAIRYMSLSSQRFSLFLSLPSRFDRDYYLLSVTVVNKQLNYLRVCIDWQSGLLLSMRKWYTCNHRKISQTSLSAALRHDYSDWFIAKWQLIFFCISKKCSRDFPYLYFPYVKPNAVLAHFSKCLVDDTVSTTLHDILNKQWERKFGFNWVRNYFQTFFEILFFVVERKIILNVEVVIFWHLAN